MYPMVVILSEQDIKDLAAYYSQQKITLGAVDPKLLERGQHLYRAGDKQEGISACIACHGPRGLGLEQANFPAVGGQHADYIVAQLKEYKNGSRKTGAMMGAIAKHMTNEDMKAVASYMSGLH